MKPVAHIYFILILLLLSSCVSGGSTPDNTLIKTNALVTKDLTSKPQATKLSAITKVATLAATITPLPTSTSTLTATMMQPPTLEPDQVKETLERLLVEPVDCQAPCFWDIVPGQTTLDEAKGVFTHLGLEINSTTVDNKDFYGVAYEFDNGQSIRVILTIEEKIVKNLRLKISPEIYQAGAPRAWLAYSPETLIQLYGTPSRVEFWVGRSATSSGQNIIIMHFTAVDLIVEYFGYDIPFKDGIYRVCPLHDNFDLVRIWLGKNPTYPPLKLIPLEDAASITLDDFAELITGDPEGACIDLKSEAFSQ